MLGGGTCELVLPQDEDSSELGPLPAVLGSQLKMGPTPFSSSQVQVVGLRPLMNLKLSVLCKYPG